MRCAVLGDAGAGPSAHVLLAPVPERGLIRSKAEEGQPELDDSGGEERTIRCPDVAPEDHPGARAGRQGPIDSSGNRLNPSIMHGGNREPGGGLDLIPRRRGTINGLNESKAPEASPDSTRSIYANRKSAESPLEADPTFIEHIRLHARAVSAVSADVVREVLEEWIRSGFVSLAQVEAQSAILPQAWVQGPYRRLQSE